MRRVRPRRTCCLWFITQVKHVKADCDQVSPLGAHKRPRARTIEWQSCCFRERPERLEPHPHATSYNPLTIADDWKTGPLCYEIHELPQTLRVQWLQQRHRARTCVGQHCDTAAALDLNEFTFHSRRPNPTAGMLHNHIHTECSRGCSDPWIVCGKSRSCVCKLLWQRRRWGISLRGGCGSEQ